MDMIWMQHPQLPPEQLICEPAEARIGHETSGWVITDPPPPPLELSFDAESESGPVELEPGAKYAAAVEARPDIKSELDGKEK